MASSSTFSPTTVRRAIIADHGRLTEMATAFLLTSPYAKLITYSPQHLHDLTSLLLELGAVFVLERAGEQHGEREILGMIALAAIANPVSGQRFCEELAFWIEPEHRGKDGVRLLLHAAEVWARAERCPAIKMVAPAGKAGLSVGKFYERRGYAVMETAWIKMLE